MRAIVSRPTRLSETREAVSQGLKHPELPKIAQQLSDLERRFLPAWFYKSEIEREPNGNLVLAGQRMPGPAQMVVEASKITSSADAPGAYAYLSSGAHPTYFAIHEMLTSTQIGAGHVRHQIDFTDVRYQASLGANAVADVLFGWNRLATWLGLGDSAEFDGCA